MNHTILIIDDDPLIRKILKKMLVNKYRLLEAENGQEALRVSEDADLDLIICDYKMPVMDGLVFLETIRKTSDVPFVVLSGAVIDEKRFLASGANKVLKKPAKAPEIYDAIKTLLSEDS